MNLETDAPMPPCQCGHSKEAHSVDDAYPLAAYGIDDAYPLATDCSECNCIVYEEKE